MKTEKSSKVSVLLVDDHLLVREGVRSCLLKYKHLEIVGEAGNGHEAINRAKEFSPDPYCMQSKI